MKKIFYVMALFVAVSFASCANNTSQVDVSNDSDTVGIDTVGIDTIDSVNVDSLVKDSITN